MDEVFKMYAMSDGDPFGKPGDLDNGQVDAFADEEDELETAGTVSYTHLDVYKRQPPRTLWRTRSTPRTTPLWLRR